MLRTPESTGLTENPRRVVVAGLSGSGKRTVIGALEDAGYYAVDNLPVDLMRECLAFCEKSPHIDRTALVVDVRERESLGRFPPLYTEIRGTMPTVLLYLDASDEAIQRRFGETRRPHPIPAEALRDSIAAERELMRPIRELADIVVDTTRFNAYDLRRKVFGLITGYVPAPALRITLGSFGFKYAAPIDADLVLDVRFLPNPNYEPTCRKLTGKDPEVARFLVGYAETGEFLERTMHLLRFVVPRYADEGKSYLSIYFGCTGGRHRSVYIAEAVAQQLADAGYPPRIQHRDIHKEQ